jgi:hypothetical protein
LFAIVSNCLQKNNIFFYYIKNNKFKLLYQFIHLIILVKIVEITSKISTMCLMMYSNIIKVFGNISVKVNRKIEHTTRNIGK